MSAKLNKIAMAIGAVVLATSAWADSDSANLAVAATVLNNCAISTGALSFGNDLSIALDKGHGALSSTPDVDMSTGSTISLVCTKDATATLMANNGANATLAGERRMRVGESYLAYQLYTSNLYDVVMDATHGISYTGTGSATTDIAIYGRILGSDLAAARAGAYTDTIRLDIVYTP